MFQFNMKFGGEHAAAPTPPPPPPPRPRSSRLRRLPRTAAAAASAPGSSGGSAAGRDLRDGLGQTAAGMGLDLGWRGSKDRAVVTARTSTSAATPIPPGKPNHQKLSEQRASAVKDYLEAYGGPSGIVAAEGFGEENPIASNKTAEGRAANRRVTVRFMLLRR